MDEEIENKDEDNLIIEDWEKMIQQISDDIERIKKLKDAEAKAKT